MKKLRALAALSAPVVAAVALATPAHAAPVTNDITTKKTCTASDVTFEGRAEWKYTYVAGGVVKAKIDRVEFSIQEPGYPQGVDPDYGDDNTTDYYVKVFDGDTRVQLLTGDDVDVNYANDGEDGELWLGRNAKNPVVKQGSRVTLGVGVDGDGEPNCKMIFRIPADLGPQIPE